MNKIESFLISSLLCIVGKSGTGKTTLGKGLTKVFPSLKEVVPYTTRPRRSESEDCYVFITKEEFNNLQPSLVEYTSFGGNYYGVTEETLDTHHIYVIEPESLARLKKKYHNKPIITVGLVCDDEVLRNRFLQRGQSDQDYLNRKLTDEQKFSEGYLNDCDIVLNAEASEEDVLQECINSLENFTNGRK